LFLYLRWHTVSLCLACQMWHVYTMDCCCCCWVLKAPVVGQSQSRLFSSVPLLIRTIKQQTQISRCWSNVIWCPIFLSFFSSSSWKNISFRMIHPCGMIWYVIHPGERALSRWLVIHICIYLWPLVIIRRWETWNEEKNWIFRHH
jgi:hypothetical protein